MALSMVLIGAAVFVGAVLGAVCGALALREIAYRLASR